jgi:hypothetical protein
MSLSALFCQARPETIDDGAYHPEDPKCRTKDDEKWVYATDENEMQQRLSDLRREVSDAKIDW